MKEKMEWKFSDFEDTAVFTTRQVIKDNMPILYVSHEEQLEEDEDDEWQFHQGGNIDIEDAMVVTMEEVIELDDTLNELCNLPCGWVASRSAITERWIRKRK